MTASSHPAVLIARALAAPRSAPQVDVAAFLGSLGLDQILDYTFGKVLSGGGTNLTAIYTNDHGKAVAKFFFTGPTGAGDAHCDRELKMLSMAHSYEQVSNIAVAPRVIHEFASADKMVVGFLMEYIDGISLEELMQNIVPGDFHESITTFARVGWARHNSMRGSIAHKDLHPGNIIFELNNRDWEAWMAASHGHDSPRVRILDFGSAVMAMQFNYDDGFDEGWYRDLSRYFNGAFTCLAPEFFKKDFVSSLQGSQAFDCWALGHILYKLYTGKVLEIADSVGHYCALIYGNLLETHIRTQINANVEDHRMRFLMMSMLQPDLGKRVDLFSAVAYANLLRLKDPKAMHLAGETLRRFVYVEGCDPEYGLRPDERSNSGY